MTGLPQPRISSCDTLTLVGSAAEFSACRRYRYTLTRRFAEGPTVAFIGLNPSGADEWADDPTIRRCLGFARRWGYGQLIMLNVYAFCSTDSKELWRVTRPEGEVGIFDRNLRTIVDTATNVELVVCAWGANPGPIESRPELVVSQLERFGVRLVALALTKHGQPRHPLYVRGDVDPIPYPPAEKD